MSNVASHGSGGEEVDVFSPSLINPGADLELSLWLSWSHKQQSAEPPTVSFQFPMSLDERSPFHATDL
jgi:hypothetical protein